MSDRPEKLKETLFQLIVKIWTVHVIAVVLYLFVLILLVRFLGDQDSLIVASVIVPVAYLVFTYLEAWRHAYKDRNMVNFGRVREDRLRGLKAAVISQIPGILCAILSIWGNDSGIVSGGVRYFFISMAYEFNNFGEQYPVLFLLPALLPILSVVPGYALGYRDKRIVNVLLYTRKKDDD